MPPSVLLTDSPLPHRPMIAPAERRATRRRWTSRLRRIDRTAEVERITALAETWALDARIDRLIARLDAITADPPLAHVPCDWRDHGRPCTGGDA